jgi:branched-chain amino acid transport system ATP-binding protein
MSAEVLLSVQDLTVDYGPIRAVRGVSFEVRRGEIVTLIGANGAGKSSALRAISGMLPYGGKIVFDGEDLSGIPADRIVGRGLAHVPEGRGIFGNLTVQENLKLAAWRRRDRAAIRADEDRVFELFPRLRERLRQSAGTLSGGEQQMLALGRALMTHAKLLLLDEPSMGLSPILVREIFRVIAAINRAGVTVLLVEQNANLALSTAARGYVLETGSLALSGSGRDLLRDAGVRAAYLGA